VCCEAESRSEAFSRNSEDAVIFGWFRHKREPGDPSGQLEVEFARIRREGPPITLSEWNAIIASHPFFEHIPDRIGTNPFTNERVVFPGEGKAYYVVDGAKVGNGSLEGGEILTTGIQRDVCGQVAKSLNAKVFEDDRS
jgi:hypothetical protein